jgi:PAS domain S-box-containing protein
MAARKQTSTQQPTAAHRLRSRGRTQAEHTAQDDEHFYRDLVENANDAIAVLSPEGVITWVNRGAERLLGWTHAELVGQHYRMVATPAAAMLVEERNRRFASGDKPASSIFAAELVHKNGALIPVEARTRVIRDRKGLVRGFQGIYRDLTERKQAEQALRAREAYYRALLEHASDMIVILNADGTVRYSSPSSLRVLGYRLEDTTGVSGFDFVHPEDLPAVTDAFQTLASLPGGSTVIELRVRHADGSWRILEATGTNLLAESSVAGIVVNSRDVTARRESEERYRLVSQSISDYAFSFTIDAHGDIFIDWLTDSFTTVTGYPVTELLGKANPLQTYMHPDDLATVLQTVRALQPGAQPPSAFRIVTPHGETRWVQSRAQAVADASGRVIRLYGAARDITKERETAQELQVSEARYRGLVENAPDVIYTLGLDATLTSLNPAFTVHTGWKADEWINKPFGPLLHPDDYPLAAHLFQQLLNDQPVPEFRLRVQAKSGEYRVGEFRAVPQKDQHNQIVAVLGVSRNITERIEAEQRLEESRNLLARIADTIPDVLYLYDLPRSQMVYVNSRVTTVLGYTPEQIQGKDAAALRALLHPEDGERFSQWEEQMRNAAEGELGEVEYRVKHVNGAYRWFHVQASVCTRTAEGAPATILAIAEDITARQRLRALARERVIDLSAIPERLRQFRELLNMTQAKFGQTFGDHDQRQIGSYERGDTEPSLKLLASIHNHGYSLEVLFGAGSSPLLEETLEYVTVHHSEQVMREQLAVTLLQLLRRDRETTARIIDELGLPTRTLPTSQKTLLAQLVHLIIPGGKPTGA